MVLAKHRKKDKVSRGRIFLKREVFSRLIAEIE